MGNMEEVQWCVCLGEKPLCICYRSFARVCVSNGLGKHIFSRGYFGAWGVPVHLEPSMRLLS
jgi:hypothetical protein